MNGIFAQADAFNNNGNATIGNWNTSNVTLMYNMFLNATAFNQNISGWNVAKVSPRPPPNFSSGSALTLANSPVWA